ncbi:MAG: aminoacetone oxidase family FAD-binding enzyme [Luteibaculaceae bacterium]
MKTLNYNLIIVGGGAAGVFAAINYAKRYPNHRVLILEKSAQLLGKVKISGGGRCNVTHNCFNPKDLVKNYPRGGKELLENFKQFNPEHTIKWFKERSVMLKTEPDGRMFPTTNSSQTIIDCFLHDINQYKVEVQLKCGAFTFAEKTPGWALQFENQLLYTEKLYLATGSSASFWRELEAMGYTIKKPVPSLFTFNSTNQDFTDLSGLTIPEAQVSINGTKFSQKGGFLFTHWGFSGPAILKLSAFAAEELAKMNYSFSIRINWLPQLKTAEVKDSLLSIIQDQPEKSWENCKQALLPNRLWIKIIEKSNLSSIKAKATQAKNLERLLNNLVAFTTEINQKSTYKDEFVTCGGVVLEDINLETYESKKHKNLFFGGEVLNVDAVTGGFNFQAAWTSAYLFAVRN